MYSSLAQDKKTNVCAGAVVRVSDLFKVTDQKVTCVCFIKMTSVTGHEISAVLDQMLSQLKWILRFLSIST
jgi:hypothetical protein